MAEALKRLSVTTFLESHTEPQSLIQAAECNS